MFVHFLRDESVEIPGGLVWVEQNPRHVWCFLSASAERRIKKHAFAHMLTHSHNNFLQCSKRLPHEWGTKLSMPGLKCQMSFIQGVHSQVRDVAMTVHFLLLTPFEHIFILMLLFFFGKDCTGSFCEDWLESVCCQILYQKSCFHYSF